MNKGKSLVFKRRKRQTGTIRDYLSKGCIRRLARRGGVKRISDLIYDEARTMLRLFLQRVIRDSIVYCDFFKRKTILAEDVVRAMGNQGKRLYFDENPFPFSVRTSARLTEDMATRPSSSRTMSSYRTTRNQGAQQTQSPVITPSDDDSSIDSEAQ